MTEPAPQDPGVLPEGSRLVHIGPHKTGTTSLQAALFAGRAPMLEQGVRHVGRTPNPSLAVRAMTGQAASTSTEVPPPMRYWRDLAGEFRRAGEPRVVVSSEFFAWATPEVIGRIADELDPARLRIAVTLRALGRILPSQWQQNVQAGMVLPYDRWLHELFDEPARPAAAAFWALHRHDELVRRWADVVGIDRVTVVVVDERDHGMVLRSFEQLLGLHDGTLAQVGDRSNRSLTLPEAEAVRAFNIAGKDEKISRALHAKVMRYGAAGYMKQRPPRSDEPRVETPQWALDAAGVVAREMVAAIGASGVRVVGDLESLTAVPVSTLAGDRLPDVPIPADVAASMAMGVLMASGLARGKGTEGVWIEPIEMARLPTWQVGAVLVRRSRGAVMTSVRRVLRRRT